MPLFNDLTGQRFGRLTAMKPTKKRSGSGTVIWEFQCDCGKTIEIDSRLVRRGYIKSCGCFFKDTISSHSKQIHDKYDREGTFVCVLESKISKRNTSGNKGISWDSKRNRWNANIGIKNKKINLGYYEKLEDAIKARKLAEEKYFEPIIEKYKKEAGA